MLKRSIGFFVSACLLGGGLGAMPTAAAAQELVTRPLETFDGVAWNPFAYNKAPGAVEAGPEAMTLTVDFSGKGFEYFQAKADRPLIVPGQAKSMTVRYRVSDSRYPLLMTMVDGWGREKDDQGKAIKWEIPTYRAKPAADGWITASFEVPADWKPPIAVTGVGTHNAAAKNEAIAVEIVIDQITATTDVSVIDAATGLPRGWTENPGEVKNNPLPQPPLAPALQISLSTPYRANVFPGVPPRLDVDLRNWTTAPAASGEVSVEVLDTDGKALHKIKQPLEVGDRATAAVPLKIDRFGRYTARATVRMGDGTQVSRDIILAYVPEPPELTDAQKDTSPYGLNIHGGQIDPSIDAFAAAGIVWFRDYAFNFSNLAKARGQDGSYAGWPYYPKLFERYASRGLRVVPVGQKSILKPPLKDGEPQYIGPPDDTFHDELARFVADFRQYLLYWEISNEYDLPNRAFEESIGWRNYAAYHRVAAKAILKGGDGKVKPVENGRGGIFPDLVKDLVDQGDFNDIAVVNAHFYCGTFAPEVSVENFNQGDDRPTLFFDDLRETKRAGQSDGRAREAWLSEWGWDTLAGPVVSPFEQTVYLPRGWMLMMAAGIDKGFWFYDRDAPNPSHIFDGMGLLSANDTPNRVLCSLSGLTHILPTPTYVGSINAGPGTQGYVFENDGQLVASLWNIADDRGPEVSFDSGKLLDMEANALTGSSVQLTRAPVYAVGLSKASDLYLQTAYELDTRHLATASPNQSFNAMVKVTNRRDTPLDATLTAEAPERWSASVGEPISLAPGEEVTVPVRVTVDPNAEGGERHLVVITAHEAGRPIKRIEQQVHIGPALEMTVGRLDPQSKSKQLKIEITNHADQPYAGQLTFDLPSTWKTTARQINFPAVAPGETVTQSVDFTWSDTWGGQESAKVTLAPAVGRPQTLPIVPPVLKIPSGSSFTIDGDLSDWADVDPIPSWVIECDAPDQAATLYLAWSPQGLYLAGRVDDSKLQVADPKSFWGGDVLEVFIDTANHKKYRPFTPGDHQFFLVPQVKENRMYVGQWKRGEEIEATRYDITGINSAAIATDTGYVFEVLLPASEMQGYQAGEGNPLGITFKLTVKGHTANRTLAWPDSKGLANQNHWGTVIPTTP